MLNVTDLVAGYGESMVITGLELEMDAGQIVTVLGRNGIGKTTLVKTLAGLIDAQRGRITFEGQDLTNESPSQRARLGIGYVPQGREIFAKLTVRENLLVGVHASRLPVSLVDETLEHFPTLRPKLKDLGGSLSGGQQQLLALARALVVQPKLLLLDEPSEGIQPSLLDEIYQLLMSAKQRSGLSVLLVEQNLDFAGALADRAFVMDHGRIAREVDRTKLLSDADLEHEYLGADNDVTPSDPPGR
jgi:urea ABC transporter ATP-binding protein UrtE